MLIEYHWIFMGFIISLTIFRMTFSIKNGLKNMKKESISDSEDASYEKLRNTNLMLASFVIVAIALLVSLMDFDRNIEQQQIWFSMLFASMFFFFIAAMLYNIGYVRIIPYMADNFHSAGIITIGAGLFYLALTIIKMSWHVELLMFLAPLTIMVIVCYEEFLNYRHHNPKHGN